MNPKVSIIVPVYKVEKYLHKCVDSILSQTLIDFELILINDGSPNQCGVICDEYANFDSRVKVIKKENGGLSSARNAGLDVALEIMWDLWIVMIGLRQICMNFYITYVYKMIVRSLAVPAQSIMIIKQWLKVVIH